jgi:serine/threonine-protein kinase
LSALAAGSTLCDGRYELEEVVGRGGMAIVWAATDRQLERRVAIKVISDVLALDPRFVARFEREARLAAGLNHPNLVKLFDYSTEEERPFLVMEYVPGGTLKEARVPPEPVTFARELLDALAHIHEAGILHRDVKPANVLLGPDGSPRLTDFGIARSDDQTGLTLTGQVMGTLRYIAPEVAAGEPATPQSDLYSFGMVLAEVAGDDPPRPLVGLLARLTAADPADRPASAREALGELEPTGVLPREAHDELEPTTALPVDARHATPDAGRGTLDAGPKTRPLPVGRDAQPARRAGPLPEPPVRHIRIRLRPRVLAMFAVALCVAAVIVAVATSGGGSKPSAPAHHVAAPTPAAADAPLDAQLTALEQIVRSAPRR